MLENKVAIVTGASSGIGLAVSRMLVADGARVALVARTKGKLEEIARELGTERAGAFPLDVKDFAALAALPERVTARFGGLDILVNNAGLNHRGPVLDHTPEELAEVVSTNLTAPIYLTRAVLPRLRPGGIVVNVASLAGMVPVPDEAAYSASKAGLRAFTRALAFEVEGRGIACSCVCPGPVDTGFFGPDLDRVPDLVFSQPMRTAEEIAAAVLHCIRTGTPEIVIPALSGALATTAYLFPAFARAIRPLLARRGAANKRAYVRRRHD
jgi:short-subunit dehydrogenase